MSFFDTAEGRNTLMEVNYSLRRIADAMEKQNELLEKTLQPRMDDKRPPKSTASAVQKDPENII